MFKGLFGPRSYSPPEQPVEAAAAVLNFGMDAALTGLRDRGYRPAVVFDVGAAIGSWSAFASSIWPESRFVCFEPLDERRKELEAFIRSSPNYTARYVGVGDENTELELTVTDDLWGSSFAYSGAKTRSVPIRRIDTLIESDEGLPAPNFLKVDVQGFERRVLRGAGKYLENCDFVLLECQFFPFSPVMTTLDDTIGMMSQSGFVPYEIVDFMRRPLDGAMGQCDIIFARKTHQLLADKRWGA